MLAVLGRSARPVAARGGRAREGLLSKRRRSNLCRGIGFRERVVVGVEVAVAGEVFWAIGALFCLGGGIGLAGVEINQRVEGEASGLLVIIEGGGAETIVEEMEIILDGYISSEEIVKVNVGQGGVVKDDGVAAVRRIVG